MVYRRFIIFSTLILSTLWLVWTWYPGGVKTTLVVPEWGRQKQLSAQAFNSLELQRSPSSREFINLQLSPEDVLHASQILTKAAKYQPYRLELEQGNKKEVYFFYDPMKPVINGQGQYYILNSHQREELNAVLKQLRKDAGLGELIAWSSANKYLPKYGIAKIKDLETGLEFSVQRRAGKYHADVQPLTAQDSHIMKKIYGGKWSWDRRAILVQTRDKIIAASMNGMPHGAGAIGGNDFNGHFCVHFLDSEAHVGGHNLAHQLMVWKAAGHLLWLTRNLSQEASMWLLLTAVDQGDLNQAEVFLTRPLTSNEKDFLRSLVRVEIENTERAGKIVTYRIKHLMKGEQVWNYQELSLRGLRQAEHWVFPTDDVVLFFHEIEKSA